MHQTQTSTPGLHHPCSSYLIRTHQDEDNRSPLTLKTSRKPTQNCCSSAALLTQALSFTGQQPLSVFVRTNRENRSASQQLRYNAAC